jgi:hypothetical protein
MTGILLVQSKGVQGDLGSEGSWKQKFDRTNRNRIKGLSLWVTEPPLARLLGSDAGADLQSAPALKSFSIF